MKRNHPIPKIRKTKGIEFINTLTLASSNDPLRIARRKNIVGYQ